MNSHPVLIVLAIAVAAPLLAEIPIGVRLPVEKEVLNRRVRTGGLPPGYVDQ